MTMLRGLRRVGIAIGSLVAAFLCVTLVGGAAMAVTGTPVSPTSSACATIVAIVLGGFVYRDILRRERDGTTA